MSRQAQITIACLLFLLTLMLCFAVAEQMAGKNILPDSIGYINGYPNDNVLYMLLIIALISFGLGVFVLIRKKLVAIILTVIGIVLIALATFLAGFFQASIGY